MSQENGQGCAEILRAEDLVRTVPAGNGSKTIIDRFSFGFQECRIYTLAGPSGSGKTSLLRLFNRLDEKSGGEIFYHGKPVETYPVPQLRRKISLTFQIPHMFPGTVASNITYCCPPGAKDNHGRMRDLLTKVGLTEDFAGRDSESLSVGQKQRVALARSLALDPEILLLDEPTSALDLSAARTIEELIKTLNRELRLTIIMVTHNVEQALRLDGISILLVDGRLIEWGESSRFLTSPAQELTRKFVRGELR